DYYVDSLQAIAGWVGDVATEHIVRDLVELNFGADEAYPLLECEDLSSAGSATDEGLKALVDAKIITPDAKLEAHVRRTRRLPPLDAETAAPAPVDEDPAAPPAPTPGAPSEPLPFPIADDAGGDDPLVLHAARLVDRLRTMQAAR